MAKSPKTKDAPEGDPKRGDEILKRMLQSKPKSHDEMVKERRGEATKKVATPKRAK